MVVPAFDRSELTVMEELPNRMGGPPIQVYKYPVSAKEAVTSLLKRQAVWQITGTEQRFFCPSVNPDNTARAFVLDGSGIPMSQGGGKDMFGIEWEYIAQAGGSMVRPGKPYISDAEELYDKVVWPDIDSWDWERAAEYNKPYLAGDRYNSCWIMNGWYERLISFMDFEGAVMAVFDEDQKEAVKAFFEKLSELYIGMIDKYLRYFPQIDGFYVHDDWGSQKETFFSPDVAAEMIVPYMKKVTDYIHSRGKLCELHSCGQLLKQVPNIIAAGWDCWSGQGMNDTHKIYELYGDRLIVGVIPGVKAPEEMTEDELRAAAREYADKFCNPQKPSMYNGQGSPMILTPAFREELYIRSRENYGG